MAGRRRRPGQPPGGLTQPQPFSNHNGGHISFGPDGPALVRLGDGGSSGDPGDRAQDTTTLLGKILRIDPAAQADAPYGIPGDNPFAAAAVAARSRSSASATRGASASTGPPARCGWPTWVSAGGRRSPRSPVDQILGANLGWNRLEGSRPYEGEPPAGAIGPAYEYGHDEGISITGGVVYRGEAIPGLRGAYLFGDLATARVWALPTDGTSVGERVDLGIGVEAGTLVSFAEDAAGEVYVVSIGCGSVCPPRPRPERRGLALGRPTRSGRDTRRRGRRGSGGPARAAVPGQPSSHSVASPWHASSTRSGRRRPVLAPAASTRPWAAATASSSRRKATIRASTLGVVAVDSSGGT
jgi:hypothetical protein